MKKFIIAAALAWAGIATAGEYHVGKYLLCYDCHSMHGSQAHAYGAGTVGTGPANAALGGDWQYSQTQVYQFLLKGAESESCRACHDGKTFAPDVVGVNQNGYARSAGAITTGTAPYENEHGHTLDTAATPPGNGGVAMTLTCFGCHIQHGQAASYRNLGSRSVGNSQPTYVVNTTGTRDETKDVTIQVTAGAFDATAGKYIPQLNGVFGGYYDMTAVKYSAASTTAQTGIVASNRLNVLCGLCHGNFHGAPGAGAVGDGATGAGVGGEYLVAGVNGADMTGWEAFTRHPTSGVEVGGLIPATAGGSNHGHTSTTRLNSQTSKVKAAQKLGQTGFVNASPMCISCHNAHGSINSFGLRYLAGNVALAASELENGNGQYPNLCNQCHGQGTSDVQNYTGLPIAPYLQQ